MAARSKQPDLHLPFCGAEDNLASDWFECLSFLQGLNFLVLSGFWRIQFPWDLYYRKFREGVVILDDLRCILPSLAKEE